MITAAKVIFNMASITQTQTTTQAPHILLGLRVPIEERERALFDAMRTSPLLNEEERGSIHEIESRIENHTPRTLTYVLLHTIQAAMLRHGDNIQEELFIWEKELLFLLQAKLPSSQSTDDFIAEFEAKEDQAQRLQAAMIATDTVYQSARAGMYAGANQINSQIRDGANEIRAAVLNLQQNRLNELGEITERIQRLSTAERLQAGRLETLAGETATACRRNHEVHQRFLSVADVAQELVKGIHD